MKKTLILGAIILLIAGCKKDKESALPTPATISNISAEPTVGGALLRWSLPADSNFTYVEIRYKKNEKEERIQVSRFVDSVIIDGLLNKNEYQFTLQTVNENESGKTFSEDVLSTKAVRPIRRPVETIYFNIPLKANMLDVFTQEPTEGPKANLIDNNIETYWHSAWSTGVEPLPHWITVNFPEKQKVDRIGYYFRQGRTALSGRPEKIGFETSEDGKSWNRIWTSEKLNISNDISKLEQQFTLAETTDSKHVRVLFIEVNGTTNYVNLGEFKLYYKEVSDREEEAEAKY